MNTVVFSIEETIKVEPLINKELKKDNPLEGFIKAMENIKKTTINIDKLRASE